MGYNKKYADWSRKVWLEIIAPQKIFNEMVIGETPVYKEKENIVIGRKVDLNLAFLTGNFKYQNYKAIFRIVNVVGGKAYTEVEKLLLYDSYVRRLTKIGTSKISDSFKVKTMDNIELRIKPLVITRFRANRRQRNAIRKAYREYLISKIGNLDFYSLIEKVLNYELQNEVKPILNKIFPVDKVEIRKIERITSF